MPELTDPGEKEHGVRRRRIHFPPPAAAATGAPRTVHLALGLLAFPLYWMLGALAGVPGMAFRGRCLGAGMRLLVAGNVADAYHCIVSPLDSVRHFEMDFFWRRIRALEPARILDVSSPRLLPMLALRVDRTARADLVNPDTKDLERTRSMASGLGVSSRCRFMDLRVEALPADANDYQLVTCMSVLEHIVNDLGAVRAMWSRVAPGGSMLLSVPCAAEAMEEFTNIDEYGLLAVDEDGFVFWQRYYDETRLEAIFAIVGRPVAQAIYAEREPGTYDDDVMDKRTNPFYPRWREPWKTARAYERHSRVATLKGMGVIAMEFVKPSDERGRR